jgi:hypothetical protein
MRAIVGSIEAEYRRYRKLAETAMAQLSDEELARPLAEDGNSVAVLVWHVSGNLASRFTEFLTSDGEKPWRDRESEFAARAVTRAALDEKWNAGWTILFQAIGSLEDGHLLHSVAIRGVALTVVEALQRSLAHTACHAGQIVLIARTLRGADWRFLTIPPGGSAAYNAYPDREKPPGG